MAELITSLPLVDALCDQYCEPLGRHHTAYRHHIYRVINFVQYLQPDMTDEDMLKLQIAGFFHDAGIWLAGTFDYLQPSVRLAGHYLEENFNGQWHDDISALILNHHKITSFKGSLVLVENFRKADWIDVTLGIRRFGLNISTIREVQQRFPNAGFHALLVRLGCKHMLTHPLRPLPMMRR